MLRPADVSLWIVSFQRLGALERTIDGWLETFDFDEVNVIANDPTVDYRSITRAFPRVRLWPNIFRDPWETGSIAWCWNQCMRHTFETRDWCLMSQDDVDVAYEWAELITDDHWSYVAPHGDVVQLQSRVGFNHVGWFDERFRAIGGPEADYLLRMLQTYPDRLSVHDEHVWKLNHNDVGLALHWRQQPKIGEIVDTRVAYNVQYAETECFIRWIEKWGTHVDQLFAEGMKDAQTYGDGAWANLTRSAGWAEIDWYPAFTRRLRELGRA